MRRESVLVRITLGVVFLTHGAQKLLPRERIAALPEDDWQKRRKLRDALVVRSKYAPDLSVRFA